MEIPIPSQHMGSRTAKPGVSQAQSWAGRPGQVDPALLLPTEAARTEILESTWVAVGASKA